jgi:serine/threonine-protein kinase
MDRLAREATAVNQDSVDAWDMRARAAAGMGAPDEAIADLQATARSHVAQPDVRARRDRDVAEAMAVRRGELATAVRLVDEDERDVPTRGWDRGALSSLEVSRVQLLWETGDTKGSGHVAEAFLKRLPALARPERAFNDSTPTFLAYAFAGGSIGADTLRARRAAWLTEQRERYGDEGWAKIRVLAWADAYFAPGEPTPAQAADAFAALGDLGGEMPEPDAWRYEDQLVPIGALCLAAGRLDEAVRWLSLAANVCRVTPPVHAQYLLARTHETRGEKAEACTGYTTVLQAWGRARPRSVTADAARLHMKRLGCEGPAK